MDERVIVKMPTDLKNQVKEAADERHIGVAPFIRMAVSEYLKQHNIQSNPNVASN